MKYVALIVCLVGCGSVDVVDSDAAGDVVSIKPEVKPETKPEAPIETKPEAPLQVLGGGCAEDAQCGSGICASGACCDGRPGECGACVAGHLVAQREGLSCGAGIACAGPRDVSGFPGGDNVYSASESHVCSAGACKVTRTECADVVCPAGCGAIQYKGCVTDSCWCVDKSGSVCN